MQQKQEQKLKAKIYRNGNNEYWRIIPAKFTGTGKRQCRFFKTKEEAEAKAASIAKTGTSTEPEFSEEDLILFRFLKAHGIATIEQFDRTFKDLLSKTNWRNGHSLGFCFAGSQIDFENSSFLRETLGGTERRIAEPEK
jgi:hypothetical protein